MKKPFLLTALFLFFVTFSFSQNPLVKQWDYRFGGTLDDHIQCFQQTIDGGYILGGASYSGIGGDKTQSSRGLWDFWIVKTDSLGIKQWDKRFGGSAADWLLSLQQTTDGGYILGGYSQSGIGGDKSQNNWNGGTDYWIVKTDSLGTKLWDKDFGGTNEDFLSSVRQTADGGYILGGESFSGISGDKTQAVWGGYDYWMVKTDSLGNKLWDKDFGGMINEEFSCLIQTADKGYILGGYTDSGIGGDKTQASWGDDDYWIVKTDSLGIKQWDKDFGGTTYDGLRSLIQTADGGYMLAGTSQSGIGGDKTQPNWDPTNFTSDFWIIKTDALGNKLWDKVFGGTDLDDPSQIFQTYDKGYLITGISGSPISGNKTENNIGLWQTWTIKTDSLGAKVWDNTLQTNTTGYDLGGLGIQTADGYYVMANSTDAAMGADKTQPCQGFTDYWFIKFSDTTTTTSIAQLPNPQSPFSISPNPASESVVISSEFGVKEIIVFNLLGEEMLRQPLLTPNSRLLTSSLPNGMYIIKAYTGKGVFQQKLLIQH